MAESPFISSQPPKKTSQYFDGLVSEALAEIRTLAAETWTDHNIHDPGITIMEAFCYAMTEMGMRIELDIPDLITSGNRREPAQLSPAYRVLPCAPVTPADLRRVLLDHYLVSDAWPAIGVADNIAYYEDVSANPPLTYLSGTARITPNGLYDVMLTFENPDLNNNTYVLPVTIGSQTYSLNLALPHWDEAEARPFRGGNINLTSVIMHNPGNEWRALDENLAYFGEATIAYSGPDGPGNMDTWVLMRITDELEQPPLEIPGILAGSVTLVQDTAVNSLIDQFLQRVAAAEKALLKVRRYLLAWRNLAEYPVRLLVSRVQEIAVNARIEITGSTGLETLLAKIFFALDCSLTPPVLFSDLDAQDPQSMETLFDGPLLRHGFLADNKEEALLRGDRIFLSDILRLIMKQPGVSVIEVSSQENPSGRDILAVTDLAISNYINNRIITDKATSCLQLVNAARYRPRLSVSKSRIVFVRDDVEIDYDGARVETLFLELQAEKREGSRLARFSPDLSVEMGEDLPIDDYYPFQYDLPANYGVSEDGLPDDASTKRHQQMLQMRAYLMPFEQFLADTGEQLININRFFSPQADETTTWFTRPLLELGGMDKLVSSFTSGNWTAFVANPDNAYVRALQTAAEDEARALDRRNRMLDHLLARHGEDAVTWGQELHRWGQKSLLQTTVNQALLPKRIIDRRLQVNRRLLQSKAAFLADIPDLHALRLQGVGDPLNWDEDMVVVEQSGHHYLWRIERNGIAVFESPDPDSSLDPDEFMPPAVTEGEALAQAREVIQLAGTAGYYGALNFGGASNRRYVLRDGPDPADQILARGASGFPNLPEALAAAVPVRLDLASLRIRESRTAMERRIDHLTGIRYRGRRLLLNPVADHFEIFDATGPTFTKRWRLWSETSFTGNILLVSDTHFSDPLEADAIALASANIETALVFAIDEWNYRISETTPAVFLLELIDRDEVVLAASAITYASHAEALQARDRIITLLYEHYSLEGFHMVENLLLRPQAAFAVNDYFETFDVAGPAFSKRWRLWSDAGFTGDIMLVSDATFNAPVEADALAFAMANIEHTLQFAIYERNYRIIETVPGIFSLELIDRNGVVLAVTPITYTSLVQAQQARDRLITSLYDPFLEIPVSEAASLADPWSQRLTIVLPSGYERNFAVANAMPQPSRPHRFRDLEFRRHAERMIRQSCPAHLYPDIRWVDRQEPGSADDSASFDIFEQRFFAWLQTLLIDGAADAAIKTARNLLITSINAIISS